MIIDTHKKYNQQPQQQQKDRLIDKANNKINDYDNTD